MATSARLQIYAACLCVTLYVAAVQSCSIDISKTGQPPWLSMEATLEAGQAVVYGTHTEHIEYDGVNHLMSNDTISVLCVLKEGGLDIPQTIYLQNVGVNTCDRTRIQVGNKYLIAIKAAMDNESPNFEADFPYAAHSAAFEASEANLNTAARLCGVDNQFSSPGDDGDDVMCPARTVTADTCLNNSPETRTASPLAYVLLLAALWSLLL